MMMMRMVMMVMSRMIMMTMMTGGMGAREGAGPMGGAAGAAIITNKKKEHTPSFLCQVRTAFVVRWRRNRHRFILACHQKRRVSGLKK